MPMEKQRKAFNWKWKLPNPFFVAKTILLTWFFLCFLLISKVKFPFSIFLSSGNQFLLWLLLLLKTSFLGIFQVSYCTNILLLFHWHFLLIAFLSCHCLQKYFPQFNDHGKTKTFMKNKWLLCLIHTWTLQKLENCSG